MSRATACHADEGADTDQVLRISDFVMRFNGRIVLTRVINIFPKYIHLNLVVNFTIINYTMTD